MVTALFSSFIFKKYLLGYSLLVSFASKHHICLPSFKIKFKVKLKITFRKILRLQSIVTTVHQVLFNSFFLIGFFLV